MEGSGPGEFESIGKEFLEIFKDRTALQRDERVLDVGCAVGRMARPLIRHLNKGSYEGFDIVPTAIDWCQANLAPLHPHFQFRHVDLYNSYYNPTGTLSASSIEFPYADDEFDFVFLTSIFTHMFLDDTENYLSEVRRVVRPGGRVLATFFLLDESAKQLIRVGKTSVPFEQEWDHGRIGFPDEPELAVAFDLPHVLSMLKRADLVLRQPILFGNWCERRNTASYQDILIADRL